MMTLTCCPEHCQAPQVGLVANGPSPGPTGAHGSRGDAGSTLSERACGVLTQGVLTEVRLSPETLQRWGLGPGLGWEPGGGWAGLAGLSASATARTWSPYHIKFDTAYAPGKIYINSSPGSCTEAVLSFESLHAPGLRRGQDQEPVRYQI